MHRSAARQENSETIWNAQVCSALAGIDVHNYSCFVICAQETLIADLRECLETWERLNEYHVGVINWTHFDGIERGQIVAITDKSKAAANADERHGECSKYNPGSRLATCMFT